MQHGLALMASGGLVVQVTCLGSQNGWVRPRKEAGCFHCVKAFCIYHFSAKTLTHRPLGRCRPASCTGSSPLLKQVVIDQTA